MEFGNKEWRKEKKKKNKVVNAPGPNVLQLGPILALAFSTRAAHFPSPQPRADDLTPPDSHTPECVPYLSALTRGVHQSDPRYRYTLARATSLWARWLVFFLTPHHGLPRPMTCGTHVPSTTSARIGSLPLLPPTESLANGPSSMGR